jgi:hypothetical protein
MDEKTDFSKEKEQGLHGWFARQGGKGKSKGWVDCNTCRDGKCKSCGRKEGESRSKYPACRPTPSACKTRGKGKSWGKKSVNEDEYLLEPKRPKPKTTLDLGISNEEGKGIDNIIAVYNDADDKEKDYWGKWYHYANKDVTTLSNKYGIDFRIAAAVVAVLSPGNKWLGNLYAAEKTIEKFNDPSLNIDINAYPDNVIKALKILETGDVAYVRGPKVSVFFLSLVDPQSVDKELVLDSHAINIWFGIKRNIKKETPTISNKIRKIILEDYKKAAEILGISLQSLQAVTWYVWKYTKKPPVIKHTDIKVKKSKKMDKQKLSEYDATKEEIIDKKNEDEKITYLLKTKFLNNINVYNNGQLSKASNTFVLFERNKMQTVDIVEASMGINSVGFNYDLATREMYFIKRLPSLKIDMDSYYKFINGVKVFIKYLSNNIGQTINVDELLRDNSIRDFLTNENEGLIHNIKYPFTEKKRFSLFEEKLTITKKTLNEDINKDLKLNEIKNLFKRLLK